MFSVATELARGAKQAMPLEQWQKYLQPGRVLERGGVKFPLRADELKYGPMAKVSDPSLPAESWWNQGTIKPEDFAKLLEDIGGQEGGGYPAFRTLPSGSDQIGILRKPGDPRAMFYENQYQLPGERLGQSEELTLLPGSNFTPSTGHFGGQPGLLSWSRQTRRPVTGTTPANVDAKASELASAAGDDFNILGPMGQDQYRKAAANSLGVKSGETATHLEEIQSDWHQRAREEGYAADDNEFEKWFNNKWRVVPSEYGEPGQVDLQRYGTYGAEEGHDRGPRWLTVHSQWSPERAEQAMIEYRRDFKQDFKNKPPRAPYEKTYPELELKKGIANAIHNGDSYVTWTTGDQQADRWGQALRNSVDEIHWQKTPEGKYTVIPMKGGREVGADADERFKNLDANQLEDLLGVDVAKKVTGGEGIKGPLDDVERKKLASYEQQWDEGVQNNWTLDEQREYLDLVRRGDINDPNSGVISGDNLTVGGAGMRLFYDRKVPEAARKLAAQYGGEVTKIKIPGERSTELPSQSDSLLNDLRSYDPLDLQPDELHDHIDDVLREIVGEDTDAVPPAISRAVDEVIKTHKDGDATLNGWRRSVDMLDHELRTYVGNQAKHQEVHALRITPEMRKKVMEAGLPLFSAGALAGMGTGLYGETGEPVQGYAEGGPVDLPTDVFPSQHDDVDLWVAKELARRRAINEFSNTVFADDIRRRQMDRAENAADAERHTHWDSYGSGTPNFDWTDSLNEPARSILKAAQIYVKDPLEFVMGMRPMEPGENFGDYQTEQGINTALTVGTGATGMAALGKLGKGALRLMRARPWTAAALAGSGMVGGAHAASPNSDFEDMVAGHAKGGSILSRLPAYARPLHEALYDLPADEGTGSASAAPGPTIAPGTGSRTATPSPAAPGGPRAGLPVVPPPDPRSIPVPFHPDTGVSQGATPRTNPVHAFIDQLWSNPEMSDPRSVRNNNPGNIEHGDDWQGLAKEQPDKRFAKFTAPEYGARAMVRILQNYNRKYGLATLPQLIGRWAPPGENDTAAYVARVSKLAGLDPKAVVDFHDPDQMFRLTKAMATVESGDPTGGFSDDVFRKGVELAGVG